MQHSYVMCRVQLVWHGPCSGMMYKNLYKMNARKLFGLGQSRGSVGAPQCPPAGGLCAWRGTAGALPAPRASGAPSARSPQAELSIRLPLPISR